MKASALSFSGDSEGDLDMDWVSSVLSPDLKVIADRLEQLQGVIRANRSQIAAGQQIYIHTQSMDEELRDLRMRFTVLSGQEEPGEWEWVETLFMNTEASWAALKGRVAPVQLQ